MIGNAYGKGRSLAFFTGHQQLSVLHLYHILADGQSETCASILARDSCVSLFKRFKNGPQSLFTDPYTRVLYDDLDDDAIFISGNDTGRYIDMALIRKLKRIAEYIIHHLAKPVRITFDD